MNPDPVKAEPDAALVYSRKQAAKLAGLCLSSFDEALRQGQFTFIKVGNRILIPKRALHRALETQSDAVAS